MGLALLRAVIGLSAIVEGGAYVSADGASSGALGGGVLLIASGLSLLVGFVTPLAALVIGLGTAGLGFSWLPAPPLNVLDDGLATALVVVVAFALVLLGPGAYSLDSYLFGRREIVIAARPR